MLIPALVLPLVAMGVSFVSAALGIRITSGRFDMRSILIVALASAVLCLAGLLVFCSQTNEPYFLFELRPAESWDAITVVAYSGFLFVGALIVGFLGGLVGGIFRRQK